MPFPKRKERRRKQGLNTKLLLISIALFLINVFLFLLNNYSLLLFIVPLSVLYISYLVFKEKRKLFFLNLFLLIIVYFVYVEISFRLWAQK